MIKKFFLPLTVASLASMFALGAHAAEFKQVEYAEFKVTMNILASCSVEAADADFGDVLSTADNNKATAELSVHCSKTTPYSIALLPSNQSLAGTGELASTEGGTDMVPYTMYQDSTLSTIWGGEPSVAKDGVGTGEVELHTVHLSNTDANFVPGKYADTVRVAVGF